jgi:hypothetical protein
MPVIPIDSNSAPRRANNRTKVHYRGPPANAVANFKQSGLIAGHQGHTKVAQRNQAECNVLPSNLASLGETNLRP